MTMEPILVRLHQYPYVHRILVFKILKSFLADAQKTAIQEAIALIESKSIVKFVRCSPWCLVMGISYINISGEANGCYSELGFRAKPTQKLNLGPGCYNKMVICHEFFHALGFAHMQSTYNRDDYVTIIWENIQPGKEQNFQKYNNTTVTNFGTEYDLLSVMHYPRNAASINGSDTIVPKSGNFTEMGQRKYLTETDIIKLNALYSNTRQPLLRQ